MYDAQRHQVTRSVISGIALTLLLILGAVTAWLIPLPVLYYRIKLGRKIAMIIPAIMIILLFWLNKTVTSELVVISGWMLLGLLIGECFESGLSIEKTILVSGGAVILTGSLALFFYSNMAQTGIFDLVFQKFKVFSGYLVEAGLIAETPDDVLAMVVWVLPGMVSAMVVFFTWVNVIIALPLLRRNRLPIPDFGDLDRWKAPEKLVWVAIFGTAGILVNIHGLFLLCMNVMCLVLMVYFLQGISIVSFFVKKTRIPPVLRYFLYWLIFFQFPVNLLVTGVGLFDMWADFRNRVPKLTDSARDE